MIHKTQSSNLSPTFPDEQRSQQRSQSAYQQLISNSTTSPAGNRRAKSKFTRKSKPQELESFNEHQEPLVEVRTKSSPSALPKPIPVQSSQPAPPIDHYITLKDHTGRETTWRPRPGYFGQPHDLEPTHGNTQGASLQSNPPTYHPSKGPNNRMTKSTSPSPAGASRKRMQNPAYATKAIDTGRETYSGSREEEPQSWLIPRLARGVWKSATNIRGTATSPKDNPPPSGPLHRNKSLLGSGQNSYVSEDFATSGARIGSCNNGEALHPLSGPTAIASKAVEDGVKWLFNADTTTLGLQPKNLKCKCCSQQAHSCVQNGQTGVTFEDAMTVKMRDENEDDFVEVHIDEYALKLAQETAPGRLRKARRARLGRELGEFHAGISKTTQPAPIPISKPRWQDPTAEFTPSNSSPCLSWIDDETEAAFDEARDMRGDPRRKATGVQKLCLQRPPVHQWHRKTTKVTVIQDEDLTQALKEAMETPLVAPPSLDPEDLRQALTEGIETPLADSVTTEPAFEGCDSSVIAGIPTWERIRQEAVQRQLERELAESSMVFCSANTPESNFKSDESSVLDRLPIWERMRMETARLRSESPLANCFPKSPVPEKAEPTLSNSSNSRQRVSLYLSDSGDEEKVETDSPEAKTEALTSDGIATPKGLESRPSGLLSLLRSRSVANTTSAFGGLPKFPEPIDESELVFVLRNQILVENQDTLNGDEENTTPTESLEASELILLQE